MSHMNCKAALWGGVLLMANVACYGQTLKVRPPAGSNADETIAEPPVQAPVRVELSVPPGTPIKVALDSEVRIHKVGQPIHGKTIEPIYAFNKLLIPLGTTVTGKISGIDPVGKKRRTLEAMDGNFSPVHAVHVQFEELVMADGRRLPIQTVTSPAPNGVLRFVAANAKAEKKNKVEDAAAKKVSDARQQVRQQWPI